MELRATRFEVDGPVATVWLDRPHRHNAWTGRMHAEYRWILAELAADERIRAVVVTGTPPAFCVGGDAEALAGHAERGGYDDGLRGDLARPGYGVRPELDHDFAFQFGLPFALIAAVNGAAAGVGLAVALFCDLRFVGADGQAHDRRAQARAARRVRDELDAAPPRRRDPRRRPAACPVESSPARRPPSGACGTASCPTAPAALAAARRYAPPRWPRPSDRRPCARPSASSTTTC